jgi:hypothetical protein
MKTIKTILPLFVILIMSCTARAYVLFDGGTNSYVNGCIEGQGLWYYPGITPPQLDALVTNNVLLLYSNHVDVVDAPTNAMTGPTNGWVNNDNANVTYASFRVMVTQLPEEDGDDDFFFEFRNSYPDGNPNELGCCRVFIDTLNTSVPGTFQLGIGNFDTEFGGADSAFPPINYPEDLATDTWYTVVVAYGNNSAPGYAQNANLFINPSLQDYTNFLNFDEDDNYSDTNAIGHYVYAVDQASTPAQQGVIVAQVEFLPGSQSGSEGISNVIAGSEFSDVYTYNLPVFGIQPYLFSTNYSGNNDMFYAVASGVDLTYQWYSLNYGALTNGMNYLNGDGFSGTTNDFLVVSNLSLTDTYYCKVTDAYGNTATCSNAFEFVNTTPTAPFFTNSPSSFTTNVFDYVDIYSKAFGSGPISYQWYFAPTNVPTIYSPLVGSNDDHVDLYLADFTSQGNYYVVASNSAFGGSVTVGPITTLKENPPTSANLEQLNSLLVSFFKSQNNSITKNTTYYLNQGGASGTPLTVGGYVTTYGTPVPGDTNLNGLAVGGLGNSYAEYYIQDTNGYGAEVFGNKETNNCQPPIGTYVSVSGLIEVYNSGLEVYLSSVSAVTIVTNAPPYTITPVLVNAEFNQLATNELGTNALRIDEAMVTFTNVYCYGNVLGQPINGSAGGNSGGGYNYNGIFLANHANSFYFTVGTPYNPSNALNTALVNPSFPFNTNMLECYQFNYDYPYNQPTVVANPFDGLTMQTNYYQLTGVYSLYGYGTPIAQSPEILPSRVADYVTTPPPSFKASVALTNSVSTVTWSPQVGSTYSVYSATSLSGPWTQAAYGLTYYPTNGSFTDNSQAKAKFYYITSP